MGFVDVSSWDKQDLQTNKVLDHSHRIKTALILRSFDMPHPFYWTVKICYHSTPCCNRLKIQNLKTFVLIIQNALDFQSANRANCTIKKTPDIVDSFSFSVYRVRESL